MIGDPNWLYSTIAESSAAIVAIIGGFITASVLMLLAEKRSLAHQRTDKETQLGALKVEERRLSNIYETMKVDKFFSAIADELKEVEELPTLEALMHRYPGWNLDHEILKQEYEKLSKQRLEARYFIEQNSDKIDPTQFLSFDNWVKANKLDISPYDYELLEDEYNRCRNRKEEILEEEREKVEEERRKATPPYLRGIFEMQGWLRGPKLNFIPPSLQLTQVELYQRQKEDRRLEDVESRLSSLRYEIFLHEREIANLDARLSTFSYPPRLGWGLVILGCFAFFSIFMPVMLIMAGIYSKPVEQFILILFVLGLVAVFVYIALLITELRRK